MVKAKVVLKRRQDSPVIYLGGNKGQIEKIGLNIEGKIYSVPIVKGSHFRGRFRRWFAKKILQKNLHQIRQEKDFTERFAVLTAMLYSGSITKGIKIRDNNIFKATKDLDSVDPFGRYFGYMITGLANRRSDLSIGFAVPVIKGLNDVEGALAFEGELEYIKAVSIGGGKFIYDITRPLSAVFVSRKAGVIDEVVDFVDVRDLEDTITLLEVQSESDKKDTNNIMYIEAMNTGFDLVQDIVIDSDNEKEISALLTAYKRFLKENPYIGSYSSQGYGHLEDIIIEADIQESDEALEEFINRIDLKQITDIVKFSIEKINQEKEKKEKKKKEKKEEEVIEKEEVIEDVDDAEI